MKKQSSSKIGKVQLMRKAYAEKELDLFKSFFTDDILYKPGSIKEIRGPEALLETLNEIFSPVIIKKMSPRGTWELEDVVIYDYDMEIMYTSDNKTVEFPCVDIFQFRDDKISEWRVYPLHPSFIALKI